ncbi:transposase [Rhodococcus percolatus]|nr:transposase [Rhodococcus opacus]MBP2207314.1 transposase [Rhodococcus opacus]
MADLTRIAATEFFSTTRAGYRAVLRWMRSHGDLARIGVECTGSYGAGRLRFVDNAGLEVREVTAPDRSDRRRRGKDDTIDAENAAHAAFAQIRTVTPKTRDGMVESLRVLQVTRKTAISARRVALQMIKSQVISAPEELRDLPVQQVRCGGMPRVLFRRPALFSLCVGRRRGDGRGLWLGGASRHRYCR